MYFVREELFALYGEDAPSMLAKYRHKYGPLGFSEYVAVDDCSLAAFGVAILAEEDNSTQGPSAAGSTPPSRREEPPVVPGSCRKHNGNLLVSCYPNGDDPSRGYTITHCGELIDENVPLTSLRLRFNKEALDQEKALQTLMMIIGEEETYQLEKLTTYRRRRFLASMGSPQWPCWKQLSLLCSTTICDSGISS